MDMSVVGIIVSFVKDVVASWSLFARLDRGLINVDLVGSMIGEWAEKMVSF